MENILMTTKEAERLRLLRNHGEGLISLVDISKQLDISYRQTKRIWRAFKLHGLNSVISKKRNNQNHCLGSDTEITVLSLIKEQYQDYNSTLLSEKLKERHEITASKEYVRQLKIKHGLHQPKKRKKVQIHQRRKRRSCYGELVQMDGSPHAWFEDRGPYCTLLLAIDDATGHLLSARFEPEETTAGYFRLMENHLRLHGKPVCLYTDKYGVFRVNQGTDRSKPTQFTRAMKELDIQIIMANSPQAKGRVERANNTLQDRLVKELRERGISTIEEGNQFLPTYLAMHNKRFGVEPASSFNAHRALDHKQDLDQILCEKEIRKISKNLEVRHDNQVYQIQAPNRVNRLRGADVQVIKKMNGEILIEYRGDLLDFVLYKEFNEQPLVVDPKELVSRWERSENRSKKPHKHHPWRSSSVSVNF